MTTDLGDVAQAVAPTLIAAGILAVVVVVSARRERKRRER